MENIFSTKEVYGSWKVASTRSFNAEEIAMVDGVVVVESDYGMSGEFHFKTGGKIYIPMSSNSPYQVGDTPDIKELKILTLTRGDESIDRIE